MKGARCMFDIQAFKEVLPKTLKYAKIKKIEATNTYRSAYVKIDPAKYEHSED